MLWPVAPHPIHKIHSFKFKLLKYMLWNQDRWIFRVAEPDDGQIFTGNFPLVGLTMTEYCSSEGGED